MTTAKKPRAIPIALGALQLFVALGAVSAGVGLVVDPSGAGVGLSTEALVGSPFEDYLVPGLVLTAVNGLGSILGAYGSVRRRRWAGPVGKALGAFLMAWIVVQVYWIGLSIWLQPLFFVVGAAEYALARSIGTQGGKGPIPTSISEGSSPATNRAR